MLLALGTQWQSQGEGELCQRACVCVCMYLCAHVCAYVSLCVHMHVCVCVHLCVCVCACVCVSACVCVCVCKCVRVSVRVSVHVSVGLYPLQGLRGPRHPSRVLQRDGDGQDMSPSGRGRSYPAWCFWGPDTLAPREPAWWRLCWRESGAWGFPGWALEQDPSLLASPFLHL